MGGTDLGEGLAGEETGKEGGGVGRDAGGKNSWHKEIRTEGATRQSGSRTHTGLLVPFALSLMEEEQHQGFCET